MAAVLLAGCSGQHGIASTGSPASRAAALDPNVEKNVAQAERSVARSPQSAQARAELAHAYLGVGRFDSAATTFEDAISLGDSNARDALGLALAYIGQGRDADALKVLNDWRDRLPASDYGLAIALAGQTSQGVAVLTDALRGGENSAKLRQNLAYAYALDGRWTEARVMASQDVPADKLDQRLTDWALQGRTDDSQRRVAGLLGAPLRTDPGQPSALALGRPGNPVPAFAAADVEPAASSEQGEELKPVGSSEGAWAETAEASVPKAVASAEPEPRSQVSFASTPVVQPTPGSDFDRTFAVAARDRAIIADRMPASATHLVQLGSFSTRAGAERAWGIYVARNPELQHHTLRIVEAEVRGRRYFRVTAEGFDASSSRSMCSIVKGKGGGCLAYAESRQLPGALPSRGGSGVMRARR